MELQDFNTYTANQRINEMATELTKLGVSKDLARFIHTLSGEMKSFGAGDKQYDPATGREVGTFTTYSEPYKAKGGPWPQREDIPLSHDVQVRGTKSGKDRIYDYLVNYIDSRKDVGTRLILVNPVEDLAYYVTRKTGKLSKKQMDELGIANTEEARARGVSQKRGLYLRVVQSMAILENQLHDGMELLASSLVVSTISQSYTSWKKRIEFEQRERRESQGLLHQKKNSSIILLRITARS
jgi:hypothetical protein